MFVHIFVCVGACACTCVYICALVCIHTVRAHVHMYIPSCWSQSNHTISNESTHYNLLLVSPCYISSVIGWLDRDSSQSPNSMHPPGESTLTLSIKGPF